MKRRRLSLSDKLEILARQALCPICGGPLGDLSNVDWDHEQALARGGTDTNGNLRAIHRDPCHKVKTFGTKATTRGSDVFEVAKTRRLERKNSDFLKLVSSDDAPPKPKSKWPSRPFPKRVK